VFSFRFIPKIYRYCGGNCGMDYGDGDGIGIIGK
jgi:hypothetical protein